jgi:large conductance mechanosensitive channel
MLQGFKEFVLKGNLVELAVAFVMGLAFASVVTEFTNVLMGFIGKVGGQPDFSQVELAGVNVGLFINAVISFLIIAAVLYFLVVLPVNKLMARYKTEPEPAAPTRDCPECLSSIPQAATRCAFCSTQVTPVG